MSRIQLITPKNVATKFIDQANSKALIENYLILVIHKTIYVPVKFKLSTQKNLLLFLSFIKYKT